MIRADIPCRYSGYPRRVPSQCGTRRYALRISSRDYSTVRAGLGAQRKGEGKLTWTMISRFIFVAGVYRLWLQNTYVGQQ